MFISTIARPTNDRLQTCLGKDGKSIVTSFKRQYAYIHVVHLKKPYSLQIISLTCIGRIYCMIAPSVMITCNRYNKIMELFTTITFNLEIPTKLVAVHS